MSSVPKVDGWCPRCYARHDSRSCPKLLKAEGYCKTHESPSTYATTPCDHMICIQHGFWNRDGRLILKLLGLDAQPCEIEEVA